MIQETADYLGMSRASLASRGWRIKNRLPAIKIGRAVRFDLQMLDRWTERHREHLPRLLSEEDEERRSARRAVAARAREKQDAYAENGTVC